MRPKGFTLIEVLIALALMTLLAGLMAEFGLDLADRKQKLTSLSTQQHSVTALFQRIDRALTAADIHGQGVRVTENSLVITSRRVLAKPSLEEFDVLTVSFDQDSSTLTSNTEQQVGAASTEGVLFARFRAFDGEQWGSSGDGSLPQAVEVELWFAPNSPETGIDPDAEQDEEQEMPPSRIADRWRVIGLIDTLPEPGS